MKIIIVQTSAVSSAQLKSLIKEIIPEATVQEIIDSSLIDEVVAHTGVTPFVHRRLATYYAFAQELGADMILNQCSSVDQVAYEEQANISIPIVCIDKGMAVKAVSLGQRIGMVATVASTVKPSLGNLERAAKEQGRDVTITPYLVDGAMELLIKTGNVQEHNRMVVGQVEKAAQENDVVVLAQGSMDVLMPELTHISKPVFSSPRIGVEYLRQVAVEKGIL